MHAKLRTSEERLTWLFRVLGAACIFVSIVFRLNLGPPLDAAFFAGAALFLVAPLFRRPSVFRSVELELEPGKVTMKYAGPFGGLERHVILVRELTGASVAKTERSVIVALARGPKRRPLVLELDSEADATRIRDSLGIARAGFGFVLWNRGPRVLHLFAALTRIGNVALCVGIVGMVFADDSFAATLDVQSTITKLVVALAAFTGITPWVAAMRTLALMPSGVHVFEERPRTYAYRDIVGVTLRPNAILIDVLRHKSDREDPVAEPVAIHFVPPRALLGGLLASEAAAIVDQIRAASERARNPQHVPEHADEVRLLIARRPNEALLDWITRLDDMADAWRTSPPRHGEAVAYRHALWTAVEDHDGDDVVRVLAARVLSRLDPDVATPKIRVIASTVRDEGHAARLRAATETDAEPFVRALEKGRAQ